MTNSTIRHRIAAGLLAAFGAATGIAGVAEPAGAIIGGQITNGASHPYYVRLSTAGKLCGGSVIAPTVVLTAAHCVDEGVTSSQVTLYVSDKGTGAPARGIQLHPLWTGSVEDGHDLALVKVDAAATSGVTPVGVGDPRDATLYEVNRPAVAVGRGRTSPTSGSSAELRVLSTYLRSDGDMDDVYNSTFWFDNWNSALMLGAGTTTETVCFGDSGGPLTVNRNGARIQVGVASFTDTWRTDCDQPGGFAELQGAQLAWLGSAVKSIMPAWGTCRTRHGSVGNYVAKYDSTSAWLPNREGRFYWGFVCELPPAPPKGGGSSGGSTPPPDDTPPPCYPHCRPDEY